MTEPIQIDHRDMIKWAMEQDPNRPCNMEESSISLPDYTCGCLMMQYGNHLGFNMYNCGYRVFSIKQKPVARMDNCISKIVPIDLWGSIKNFGDLQKLFSQNKDIT